MILYDLHDKIMYIATFMKNPTVLVTLISMVKLKLVDNVLWCVLNEIYIYMYITLTGVLIFSKIRHFFIHTCYMVCVRVGLMDM